MTQKCLSQRGGTGGGRRRGGEAATAAEEEDRAKKEGGRKARQQLYVLRLPLRMRSRLGGFGRSENAAPPDPSPTHTQFPAHCKASPLTTPHQGRTDGGSFPFPPFLPSCVHTLRTETLSLSPPIIFG